MKDPFADALTPQVVQKKVLESDIENPAKEWMRKRGYWVRKFKSPSNRSVPDDIFSHALYGIFAVEFKAPRKTSTDKQIKEQDAMEAAGWEVWRDVDNLEEFKRRVIRRETDY